MMNDIVLRKSNGKYIARILNMEDCVASGKTMREAMSNIKIVHSLYLKRKKKRERQENACVD